MPIINTTQNNFASGQLSPAVRERIDRPFYKNGVEICLNWIPLLTGGLKFRPGTTHSVHSRLNRDVWGIPYRFNVSQAYTIEFTDFKIRVHTGGGVILEDAKTITGVTKASPGVVTSGTHGFSTGDEVFISGVVGMTELNSQFFLVVKINNDTFSLTDIDGDAISTAAFTAYSSGGSVARIFEIASPYLASEGPKIKYGGVADLMYLVHPDHEPRVLIRSGNADWALAVYTRYSAESSISAITKASPGVITTAESHLLASGDQIYISQINGMEELNATEYLAVVLSPTTLSITDLGGTPINTTAFTTYIDEGKIAPVRDANLVITGITKADPGVITIASHGLSTYDKIWIDGIVGMTELNDQFLWVIKIDANTFSLTNEVGVGVDTSAFTTYSSGGAVNLIRGLFTKINDFPNAVGFYGGRQTLGSTNNDPAVFWQSMGFDLNTGESRYDDYSIGTKDVDALLFTLTSHNNQAHRLYWFSGTPAFMLVGTSSGVYKVNGGSDGAAILPGAIASFPISTVGARDMMPLVIDNQTYYVEQGGLTLRGFGFSLLEDEYKAFDKSVLSDEITDGGIVQIMYAKGRPQLIFVVLATGRVLTCTILEQDDVAGWAEHPIGGNGTVLSVVTEPQQTGFDKVGLFVERTIDGATRRYIEYMFQDPIIPDPLEQFTSEDNEEADLSRHSKLVFELQKTFVRLDSSVIFDTTQTVGITLSALTGSAVTVTAGSALFSAGDVGKYVFAKFLTGEETGIALITGFTNSTVVTVKVLEDFSALTFASGGWYLLATTIGGLGHLEGEVVGILTDGAVHPNKTVVSGSITLDYPSRYGIIGKRYLGIGRTLDIEIPLPGGISKARLRSVEKLFLGLRDTLGGKFGTARKGMYTVTEAMYRREGSSYYDRPPLLYSGTKQITIGDTWANVKKFYFLQDQPLPITILSITPSIDIGEEE